MWCGAVYCDIRFSIVGWLASVWCGLGLCIIRYRYFETVDSNADKNIM
jgi:hypothetical protein